ncbi:MAG: HTTM domain-containing protein [Bdellovibrionales bacterium]
MALELSAKILGLAFLFQGLELFVLSRQRVFQEVWSYSNIQGDWEGVPFVTELLRLFVFSPAGFSALLVVQLLAGSALFFEVHFWIIFLLFVSHLLVCFRFRGTFNGGSDMMLFVVLTGLLIGTWSPQEKFRMAGEIYVAIHLFLSYFKAGLVKVRSADWRSGRALPAFLKRSLFPEIRKAGSHLESRPGLTRLLAASVLAFELSVVLIPIFPQMAVGYCGMALTFHALNVRIFGLSRFLLVWSAAWPLALSALASLR